MFSVQVTRRTFLFQNKSRISVRYLNKEINYKNINYENNFHKVSNKRINL